MATYTVKPGDTLYAIARRFEMKWRELYSHPNNTRFRANHPDPDKIYPGDVLWVPDEDEDQQEAAQAEQEDKPDRTHKPTEEKRSSAGGENGERLRINPWILHGSKLFHPYRVHSGDTLKNIADRVGCTWQDLAIINWGTDDPNEINWHLEHYFVCQSKVGANYVFTDEDEPGILLLPRQFDPPVPKWRRVIRASRWQRA